MLVRFDSVRSSSTKPFSELDADVFLGIPVVFRFTREMVEKGESDKKFKISRPHQENHTQKK